MFDVFGEFDSCEEINTVAQTLYEEQDWENLKTLARENGLEDMLEVYSNYPNKEDIVNGEVCLCDPIMAAIGKLKVEKENAKGWEFLAEDVVGYLMGNCDEESFAREIRKKGKRIEKVAALIAEEAKKNSMTIPGGGRCHYCGPMKGYKIIRDYYKEA